MNTNELTFPPIEYKGFRVLNTLQLAEAYGTTPARISENFNRNVERFQEGVHYFCLSGEVLKDFRANTQIAYLPKNVHTIYLWTERGALLHAKSLNTDKAWEVYEFLLENYFRVRQILIEEQNKLSISDMNMIMDKVNAFSEEFATLKEENRELNNKINVLTEENEKLKQEVKKSKQKIKETDKKFTEIIKLDREDIIKLKEQISELSQKIYMLTKDKFKINEQINYMKEEERRLNKEKYKLENKINALNIKFTEIIMQNCEDIAGLKDEKKQN